MLGYVRAYKPEMKFKDFDLYKGVYCSLCKEIGRRYGLIARLTLSYDFTFFAMLRIAVRNDCVKFSNSRCSFNPAKKCLDCGKNNSDLEYTADVSMLMIYQKIRDNISDGKFFKRLICKMAMPYVKRIYKKASSRIPKQADMIAELMSRQDEIEKTEASVDAAADQSAKMLAFLVSSDIDCENADELKNLGYFVGRWVYIIDAVDDCEKDIKNNNFNPLKNRFGQEGFEKYCEEVLIRTVDEAMSSYNKLKIFRFKDILSNILYDGTYSVMKKVLKKEALK